MNGPNLCLGGRAFEYMVGSSGVRILVGPSNPAPSRLQGLSPRLFLLLCSRLPGHPVLSWRRRARTCWRQSQP